jgi:hypothetical protein
MNAAWTIAKQEKNEAYCALSRILRGMSMSSRRTVKRLSKKEFLKKVTHGALSADRVMAELVEELQRYEQKYGMRSEVFHALIVGTPAEDHPDFLQWAMCYRSYFRAVQAKFPVKELAAYAV